MVKTITSGYKPQNPAYQESIAKLLMQQGTSTAPVYGWGQGLARILAGVVGANVAKQAGEQRDKYDIWKEDRKQKQMIDLLRAKQDLELSKPTELERNLGLLDKFKGGQAPTIAPAPEVVNPPAPEVQGNKLMPSVVQPQPASNQLPQKPASNMFLDKVIGGFKPKMTTPPPAVGDGVIQMQGGKPVINQASLTASPFIDSAEKMTLPPDLGATPNQAQPPVDDIKKRLVEKTLGIESGFSALPKEAIKRYYTLQDEIDAAQEVSRQNQIAQSLIPEAITGAQAGNLNSLNKMAIQLGFGGDEDIKAASSTDQLVKILSERVVGRAKELGYNPSNADVVFIQNASGSIETLAPALQRILKINDEANKFKIDFNRAQQDYIEKNRGSLAGFKFERPVSVDVMNSDTGTFAPEKESRLNELLKKGGYIQ